ncbi:MAG: hypothetical protein HYU36_20625 [Planctomycetes bacterium]|nr:hypothetical protein [Planctomycetota bacterium]
MDFQTLQQVRSALRDPEILGTLTPALAVGFGVFPLAAKEDYVVIGHIPGVCPDCFTFLENYYGKEIVAVQLDEKVATAAIHEAYLKGQSINHDTFSEPDFLLKPENESKLLNEKQDEIGSVKEDLNPEEVLFLETSYRSVRVNLDSAGQDDEKEQIDSEEIPFKVMGGTPTVYQKPIASETFLVERRNYRYEGCENRQGIARIDVQAMPHVIHPSELQVTEVHADGSLTLYVYDHFKRVAAGSTARFDVPYYFISFGQRYRRLLTFRIHALWKFRREQVLYASEAPTWDLEDMARWFCLE